VESLIGFCKRQLTDATSLDFASSRVSVTGNLRESSSVARVDMTSFTNHAAFERSDRHCRVDKLVVVPSSRAPAVAFPQVHNHMVGPTV
jgi:hypothetical protein